MSDTDKTGEAEKILYLVSEYGRACVVADEEDTKTAHDQAEALYDQIAALVRAPKIAGESR